MGILWGSDPKSNNYGQVGGRFYTRNFGCHIRGVRRSCSRNAGD